MNPAQTLHQAGQSLWLDSISRHLLTTGTLARYVDQLAVTGLTSNPTIPDYGAAATCVAEVAAHGLDVDALAESLQRRGARAFEADWAALLDAISAKTTRLTAA